MNDQLNPADLMDFPHVTAIDLALSGGGFRATLFHLGVIGFLRERRLLKRVKNICSVSGGSILAAHLVTYWNDYIGGDDEAFRNRVRHLVESIQKRDVSGEVLKRSKSRILSMRPLDSELLVAEYRRLLDSDACEIRRWDDLEGKTDHPQLYILATHLNTGQAGAFTAKGFRLLPAGEGRRHKDEINAFAAIAQDQRIGHQDIARAIAASSAFPPAFSPIPLVEGDVTGVHLLTDGGVYDNSGVKYLEHLYKTNGWTDTQDRMVILSDAGREFPTELGNQYATFMALAMRVTDTQGDRIAEADSGTAKTFFEICHSHVLKLSIHDVIGHFAERPANHSERAQAFLGMIRTELDKFTREEVLVLYRHGYLAAQKSYAASFRKIAGIDFALTGVPWTPVDPVVPPDGADRNEGRSTSEDDLSSLGKVELEKRLEDGHVIKKQAELATSLPCWIVESLLWKYWWLISGIVVSLLLIAGIVAWIGFCFGASNVSRVVHTLPPTVPTPVAVHGALTTAEVEPYKTDGWAANIPILTPVLSPPQNPMRQYVYTFATKTIGTLTGKQPHVATIASFQIKGELANAQFYLFVEQETSPGEFQHVVLKEASTRKLKVPAGKASDRILGVIVSQTEIPDLQTMFQQHFIIELETP